ncbi:MAG: pyridoxamine 5'-phosphate oxidase family protein [Bryobacteraceae bacterium]|nr:pyridoxamine 5'-phosphate oxidase family protein [Bryobacteraceae bacterium]
MELLEKPEELRQCYEPALERAVLKTLPQLDGHCRRFIALSPFLCLGTSSKDGADVTPRGDSPGFVHVLDDRTLAIPDWRGNNRLDALTNIIENPQVGLLFLVPGVEETLRVNGVAHITTEPTVTQRWRVNGNHPKSAIIVTVREAFLHCGKALIRSHLWQGTYQVDRSALPSYGQMLKDQIVATESAVELERSIAEAYRTKLY